MKRIATTSGVPGPSKTGSGTAGLAALRVTGAGPDPAFRAALRERLLAEARARTAPHGDRLDRADTARAAAPSADSGNSAR